MLLNIQKKHLFNILHITNAILLYLLFTIRRKSHLNELKMKLISEGNIVKFHTPLPNEDPHQLYVVLEVINDDLRARAKIQALNTGLPFAPVLKVKLEDLEIVEVDTNDLIGHAVTITKDNNLKIHGRVIKVSEQKIEVNMSTGKDGIETNVWLTIVDKDGVEHLGTLVVVAE